MQTILKRSPASRILLPVSIVLLAYVISHLVYFNSWRIDNSSLQHIIAFSSGLLMFHAIGYGTLIVYPMAFFRGAGPAERIIASLITPSVWVLKELIRVREFFTIGETLYYSLNSAFLLAIIGAFAQMGICELACRRRLKKRYGADIRIVTPLPLIAIGFGFISLYVMLIWGVGEHWFYVFVTGYKVLFH